MQAHGLAVLEHERDRVRGEQDERDQPHIELGLPVLLELAGVDGGAAPETHAAILCCCVCREYPRDESRLLRRDEAPRGLQAEGGAGRLAGKCAEPGLAEVAITAGCFGSLAHNSSRSGVVRAALRRRY